MVRMASFERLPTGSLIVRTGPGGDPFYEAKWRAGGRQLKRRVGPAWLDPDPTQTSGWKPRRGRVPEGHFDEKRATVRMAALIDQHHNDAERRADAERASLERPATFREIAAEWFVWLEEVKGARPSTLRDYGTLLAEPGTPHRRGSGRCAGRIMAAFGDRPAGEIKTVDVSRYLRGLDRTTMAPRTINKHRQLLSAIFAYATREDTFALPANPARATDKRREPPAAALDFYEPEEIECLARAAADGQHRAPANGRGGVMALSDEEIAARCADDAQDAELFRLLAYTGLRVGEAIAVRWSDADLGNRRLIVQRAVSGTVEGPTKGWQVRYVPLADPAYDALVRLQSRGDFTDPDDYVFCSRLGGRLDPSALRRRFHAARKAAQLRHIKLHGLRHGAGSLVARHTDAVFVQHFLGHANIATTERYMHAKVRLEDLTRLNEAFRLPSPESKADDSARSPSL
jgi:integrase